MFKEIFSFEIKQWIKRPGIYIYFLIFFVLAFLLGALVGGMFKGTTSDTNTYVNSATAISSLLTAFSSDYLMGLITIMICIALMAGSVQKDFQHNCFSFYFTKPISKFAYIFGRFSATFLLTVFVMTAVMFGLWLALLMSPNDNGQIGPFTFMNFFQPFVLFLIPNAFLIGAIFFSLVTFTRNMISGYVGGLLFIVVGGITRSITGDLENKTVAALLDPFGQQALDIVTDYWTPAENNARMVPFSGYILYNRLFWLGLSCALLLLTYYRFSFNQFLNPVSIFSRKKNTSMSPASRLIQSIGQLPQASRSFGLGLHWKQLLFLTRFEYKKIARSVFFYIILGLCVILAVVTARFSHLIYGTETYPLTYMQIDLSNGVFRFFSLVMVIFYSGIVIWRERDHKVDELVGASPVPNGVLFLSKFFSLVLMSFTVYVVNMLTCMMIQAYSGYYNFELGLYIKELILMRIFSILSVCALAASFQVFFRNRYFGYFAMVIITVALPVLYSVFSYKNHLLQFNSAGDQLEYSDMNGYGHTLGGFFVYKFYWLGFVMILAAIAVALYQRGKEYGFNVRWRGARKAFTFPYKSTAVLGMLCFFGCGSMIYYNIRILHPYKTAKQREQETADFEKKYKKYEKEPQPRVVESNLSVDIFPDQQGAKIKGFYYLKNKHKSPLSKIIINVNSDLYFRYAFAGSSKNFLRDTVNGIYGEELNKPLMPGDSIKLDFKEEYFPKGLIIKDDETQVVENGTFFNSNLLPSIGYNPQGELSSNSARKKHGLPPKPRMNPVNDTNAYGNTYISSDADWIRFECVVSTKEGQIAIAPGYLQKDWTGNLPDEKAQRHFYHYKMDAPILNFYAFLSAGYQVKRDQWKGSDGKDVNIEIYYNKGHEYNLDRMIRGVKKSLDYYTKNFSPYQHRQVRIIEFPRYETFAQSFPNTIPFSESIGFVAKVKEDDPNEVDYPFYVTAHEVGHQWWAHQVIGADVQGSTLMSETMSQYSALMVMEKEYGQAAMKKFLKYEMDTYLQGRAGERKKELPLILCENQQYIHYNKGSVVMYALKDYLGEDTLNAALRRYIKKVAFQEPPYTTSLEFYKYILEAAPDSLKETVRDLFERIVVFDNNIKNWSYTKTPDGKYKISGTLVCVKTRSDSLGKAKEVTPGDWIDLGVFLKNEKRSSDPGECIYLRKIKVTAKEQKFEIVVDKEPYMLGIDPYNKLIDKDPLDNTMDKNGKAEQGGNGDGAVVIRTGGEDD